MFRQELRGWLIDQMARFPRGELAAHITPILDLRPEISGQAGGQSASWILCVGGAAGLILTAARWRTNLHGGADVEVVHDGRTRPMHADLIEDPDEVADPA
jgi:hypothetical protein